MKRTQSDASSKHIKRSRAPGRSKAANARADLDEGVTWLESPEQAKSYETSFEERFVSFQESSENTFSSAVAEEFPISEELPLLSYQARVDTFFSLKAAFKKRKRNSLSRRKGEVLMKLTQMIGQAHSGEKQPTADSLQVSNHNEKENENADGSCFPHPIGAPVHKGDSGSIITTASSSSSIRLPISENGSRLPTAHSFPPQSDTPMTHQNASSSDRTQSNINPMVYQNISRNTAAASQLGASAGTFTNIPATTVPDVADTTTTRTAPASAIASQTSESQNPCNADGMVDGETSSLDLILEQMSEEDFLRMEQSLESTLEQIDVEKLTEEDFAKLEAAVERAMLAASQQEEVSAPKSGCGANKSSSSSSSVQYRNENVFEYHSTASTHTSVTKSDTNNSSVIGYHPVPTAQNSALVASQEIEKAQSVSLPYPPLPFNKHENDGTTTATTSCATSRNNEVSLVSEEELAAINSALSGIEEAAPIDTNTRAAESTSSRALVLPPSSIIDMSRGGSNNYNPTDNINNSTNNSCELFSESELAAIFAIETQAMEATALSVSSSSSEQPHHQNSIVSMLRLIAVDVRDDHQNGKKYIRAFQITQRDSFNEDNEDGHKSGNRSATNITQAVQHYDLSATMQSVVTVEVSGDWYSTDIKGGDVLHIVDMSDQACTNPSGGSEGVYQCGASSIGATKQPYSIFRSLNSDKVVVVNNNHGLLIVHPDILISPTKIAEATGCQRRVVVADRVRAFGSSSLAAVMGNVKHYFIEHLMEVVLYILQRESRNPQQQQQSVFGVVSMPKQQQQQQQPKPVITMTTLRRRILSSQLDELIQRACASYSAELFAFDQTDENVRAELLALVDPTLQWILQSHMSGVLKSGTTDNNHISTAPFGSTMRGGGEGGPLKTDYSILDVTNVEDEICSPVLGMKGQIDIVTVATANNNHEHSYTSSVGDYALPIELKTGKWKPSTSVSHRAQVILYLLLMSLRESNYLPVKSSDFATNTTHIKGSVGQEPSNFRPVQAKHGVITYISQEETKIDIVSPSWYEIRGLVMSRNTLAGYMQNACSTSSAAGNEASSAIGSGGSLGALSSSQFPPLLRSERDCQYCFKAAECMVYHGACEQGSDRSSGVAALYNHVLSDVTAVHLQYFKHWDRLLDLEATATNYLSSVQWSTPSSVLEQQAAISGSSSSGRSDRCIGGLDLVCCSKQQLFNNVNEQQRKPAPHTDPELTVPQSFDLAFSRCLGSSTVVLPLEVFTVGDMVLVSAEGKRWYAKESLSRIVATGISSTAVALSDIEDLARLSSAADTDRARSPFGSSSKALTFTDAALCSGTIISINETEIVIRVSQLPRRLLSLYGMKTSSVALQSLFRESHHIYSRKTVEKQSDVHQTVLNPRPAADSLAHKQQHIRKGSWSLRLDKNESSSNIATIRSNLMSLMVNPYSYDEYKNAQQQQQQQENNYRTDIRIGARSANHTSRFPPASVTTTTTTTTTTSFGAKKGAGEGGCGSGIASEGSTFEFTYKYFRKQTANRMRQLIIDLQPPVFHTINSGHPGSSQSEIYQLLCPARITPAIYEKCLQQLKNDKMRQQQSPHHLQRPVSQLSHALGATGVYTVNSILTVYPGCDPLNLYKEYLSLNQGQKNAVKKVLTAKDYTLLLGLPGTGKTSTISLAIRMLVCKGLTVLVTSYTHSAVDNVLLKLKSAGVLPAQLLRIGSTQYVEPAVQAYLLSDSSSSSSSSSSAVMQTKIRCDSIRIVGCTVLTAARTVLLDKFQLDCCVMDEAGQITQPAAIGAVLRAKSFVLVGDDYQLPPLVISVEASALGMDISLFKRLMQAHPQAVCCLSAQYRMNKEIMSISNAVIYEGRLTCATEQVANSRLKLGRSAIDLPYPDVPSHVKGSPKRTDWLFQAIDPAQPVVFLNTDMLMPPAVSTSVSSLTCTGGQSAASSSFTSMTNGSVSNDQEVKLIEFIVQALRFLEFNLSELGILSPFRAQVEALQTSLKLRQAGDRQHMGGSSSASGAPSEPNTAVCEVSTIDKYQGKDRDMIIVSLVKKRGSADSGAPGAIMKAGGGLAESSGSNEEQRSNEGDGGSTFGAGTLLRDWRRINVATTRAKSKLILIGSFSIMSQVPVLKELISTIKANGWDVTLPAGALDMYPGLLLHNPRRGNT